MKTNLISYLMKHGNNVSIISEDEVKLNCPKCSHKNFYFNIKKQIGHCHRASCNWNPKLYTLKKFWGGDIADVGWVPRPDLKPHIFKHQVSLPKNTVPIVKAYKDELYTDVPDAYYWLLGRRLTPQQIYRWGMVAGDTRIYVPVYSKGILEQYVGRLYNTDAKLIKNNYADATLLKYVYAPNKKITDFLFGWDEQDWTYVTLVENTFVSIWLRDHVNCTTNFGSNLSDTQMQLIARSKVREVILLWDNDAFYKASIAITKLRRQYGVKAKAIRILGQPDDYDVEFIKEIVSLARLNNTDYTDVRDVCLLKRSTS